MHREFFTTGVPDINASSMGCSELGSVAKVTVGVSSGVREEVHTMNLPCEPSKRQLVVSSNRQVRVGLY